MQAHYPGVRGKISEVEVKLEKRMNHYSSAKVIVEVKEAALPTLFSAVSGPSAANRSRCLLPVRKPQHLFPISRNPAPGC